MAALYQRARPATFAEVVGQEHVKDVLLAALERGSPSHAYLFSGPRGVGKTTTARLLAMALNCEAEATSPKPCGKCDGCRMVREGHHPDVIELDAASNNSVDDVRDLREKTSLASMRGGTRVWILDEAHMLSKAAANALLKTLEEPPPGLVFVLATTEPEKLPPTVLSRCQHFRFRRHTEAEILGKLERLCTEAGNGIEAEPEALALLARAADGAMRDAESLLERLLTPGATITLAAAEEALGLPPVHRMQQLAAALAQGDLEAVMTQAESLYRDGFAPRSLADNLGTVLRDALRADLGVDDPTPAGEFRLPLERSALLRLIHALDDEQDRFIRRDDLYSLEVALLKGYNAITGNVAATAAQAAVAGAATGARHTSSTPPTPDDRAPAKHAGAGATATGNARSAKTEVASGNSPTSNEEEGLPSFDPTGRGPTPKAGGRKAGAPASSDKSDESAGRAGGRFDWHAVRSAAGPQLKAFLMPARESVEGNEVVIRYSETHKFHYTELKKREEELASLIEEVAGPGYRLSIEGPGGAHPKKS
ncbi:MAG TPA: DNA polymerase III subunit gamma/tau [Trueperaceae bacterium]